MEGRKKEVVIKLICSIFGALIGGIKYIKKPKKCILVLWMQFCCTVVTNVC